MGDHVEEPLAGQRGQIFIELVIQSVIPTKSWSRLSSFFFLSKPIDLNDPKTDHGSHKRQDACETSGYLEQVLPPPYILGKIILPSGRTSFTPS